MVARGRADAQRPVVARARGVGDGPHFVGAAQPAARRALRDRRGRPQDALRLARARGVPGLLERLRESAHAAAAAAGDVRLVGRAPREARPREGRDRGARVGPLARRRRATEAPVRSARGCIGSARLVRGRRGEPGRAAGALGGGRGAAGGTGRRRSGGRGCGRRRLPGGGAERGAAAAAAGQRRVVPGPGERAAAPGRRRLLGAPRPSSPARAVFGGAAAPGRAVDERPPARAEPAPRGRVRRRSTARRANGRVAAGAGPLPCAKSTDESKAKC